MPKYKLSPEERAAKAARKEKIRELMSEMQVEDMSDINRLFKEMVGEIRSQLDVYFAERLPE